ncbi:IPT/TIG domain-containing protein [Sphingobacterium sp. PU5-4]|uniref:IPT/TIG domain-containing protein n=1 Tax=Sphingobacterium tenebrionis TaxID=3111775 RepID=A0ABU8I0Y8_9SPHI
MEIKKRDYDPSKPVVLSSFYPLEGGARSKILLDGENFGTDTSKIRVFFNNAKASVVSSTGSRIYAIVPLLPGENPKITVVVGTDTIEYQEKFNYYTQAQVSTVAGNGSLSLSE